MLIQWYPGHMAKAKRMLEDNLKLVDVIAELVDARAPIASRNPDFDRLFQQKKRIVILNKSDLASPQVTKSWIDYYQKRGILAIEFVSTNSKNKKRAIELFERASADLVRRMREKGIHKTVRIMVCGIPNVGKSAFINCIAGGARAQVGDKPGVTRGKQWVTISPYLELLDTPGLLWPKLENETFAKHLAYLGAIKDDIMDYETLAGELLLDLLKRCPKEVCARYPLLTAESDLSSALEQVCQSRGFILPGGALDTERAARIVLDEFRAGKVAKISLEKPEDMVPYEK